MNYLDLAGCVLDTLDNVVDGFLALVITILVASICETLRAADHELVIAETLPVLYTKLCRSVEIVYVTEGMRTTASSNQLSPSTFRSFRHSPNRSFSCV